MEVLNKYDLNVCNIQVCLQEIWRNWMGYYIYRYDMISMKCSGMPPGVLEGQDGETKEMCYD